ncbi:MAG: hypothetical protein R2991_16755, partial [Thermoanaerobaculia bacterium]
MRGEKELAAVAGQTLDGFGRQVAEDLVGARQQDADGTRALEAALEPLHRVPGQRAAPISQTDVL